MNRFARSIIRPIIPNTSKLLAYFLPLKRETSKTSNLDLYNYKKWCKSSLPLPPNITLEPTNTFEVGMVRVYSWTPRMAARWRWTDGSWNVVNWTLTISTISKLSNWIKSPLSFIISGIYPRSNASGALFCHCPFLHRSAPCYISYFQQEKTFSYHIYN